MPPTDRCRALGSSALERREAMPSALRRIAPGPRGYALLGELFDIREDRLGFVTRITREFGDVVRFRMGFRVLHLVNHPDYTRYVLQANQKNYRKGVGLAEAKRWLGEGLVTSEGEVWSRQRRLIKPAFQRQRLARFSPVVTDATLPSASTTHTWAVPELSG